MADVQTKKPQSPHALDDLVGRVGKNNPKLLAALVAGTPNDELLAVGATIATPRIVIDAVRLYGEALDFYDRASQAQKTLLRGASPELLGVAVHHLDALRKLEATHAEKSKDAAAGRAVVDQDVADAVSNGITVRDQAYTTMRDAGSLRRCLVQVDEAFGVADPPEKLAAGLAALATLLLEWLDSDDADLRTRLDLASLDKSYAAELNASAHAVRAAVAAAAKRNSHKARQAELDVEDGVHVLLLGQIIRAFENAHGRDATIPRLVPISTRRLFNRRVKKQQEEAAPAAPPASPATPA